ncbi:hypothetical protein ACB098_01G371000 [Castanea mollissima]
MLEFLAPKECCIYKVPYHLRKWNEEAYTPHVISIGPYYHNKEKFRTTEKHKEDLVSTIRKMEYRIRCCDVETVQLKSDDFVEMIMFDAIFILELFLKCRLGGWATDTNPMCVENWLYAMVMHELLLLENQLTFDFFNHFNIHGKAPKVKIQHFTDLLRFFELPNENELPDRHPEVIFPKYSATQLREAGVKFEVASRNCVLNLNFNKGVLKIPLLDFQDNMEDRVQNIMALEQCDPRKPLYFTDFILILDRLVNTTTNVDLLSDKGSVVNSLGDNIVVTFITNNLNRGIFRGDMNKNYCDLCKALNAFYEERWHRWKALLRHQYFNSPWRSASTIAAIILLMLTLIQTILSIIK